MIENALTRELLVSWESATFGINDPDTVKGVRKAKSSLR